MNKKYVCSPVMAEQFYIRFDNEQDAVEREKKFLTLQVDRRSIMELKRNGKDVFGGCGILINSQIMQF